MALAGTSWRVGGIPVAWQPGGREWRVLSWSALAVLLAAWLLLGRQVLRGAVTVAELRRFVVAAAAPFAFAAPFGRDLWAYAAQGNLVRHGIDAYARGPSAAPGAFTSQVSPRWVDSPSLYGPLWLQISHLATVLSHGHPLLAVLLLRLPAFAGIGLWLWALPRLAGHLSGRSVAGLWLGLASPLTLVLGVGGGHNDVVMIGLMLAGLALACRRGTAALACGAAVAAVAVMVKSPAAVGAAFTVPFWLHANRLPASARRVVAASLVAAGAVAVTAAAISLACGLGTGWLSQLDPGAPWMSWLSLPTGATMLVRALTGRHAHVLDATMRAARTAGSALALAVDAALWVRALHRAPVACLTVALAGTAMLAPSVQPWYYCWPLALAGLVVIRHWLLVVCAAVVLAFTVMITPSGHGYESSWIAVPIVAGALLTAWLALRTQPWPPLNARPETFRD